MKKFLFSALALAGFAACSTDGELNETIAPEQKETFTLSASIITPDESRVSIGGEKYTEVSWDADDFISIRSAAGVGEDGAAVLQTEEGGRSNVRFTGDLAPKQDYDTYYAVYPRRDFSSTTVSVDYTTQDGTAKNAALLVGVAENAYKYDVNMTFSPVNSLIHVSLTDAPEALKSVVLQQKGATKRFMTKYTYDVATRSASSYGDSVITINNPAADFFIALPGGLALADGYELVFTTTGGKTFARSYKGKTFEKGTTTRISVKWADPTVTLGAKTSYSYYADGNATMANKCDNSTIYFNQGPDGDNCHSSYDNIQDAMITDLGFEVDGTQYRYSAGQVTWKKEDNTFYMNNLGDRSWAAHTVKAFIDTKHNGTIASSANLHVTGLPYVGVPPKKEHCSTTDNVAWVDDYIYLGARTGTWNANGGTITIKFPVPGNVNISIYNKAYMKSKTIGTTYNLNVSGSSVYQYKLPGFYENYTYEGTKEATLNASNPTISCSSSYGNVGGTHTEVYAIKVDYL